MDYNVDNYTVSELLAILDLDDPTEQQITDTTNKYINKFMSENQSELTSFFQNIQTKLLQYFTNLVNNNSNGDLEYTPDYSQNTEWWQNEALEQKNNDVQKNKVTDRIQKVDIYDNNHLPMKRQQLGVNNGIDLHVAQDSLNPNLENITTRFVNLDSQFRQASGGTETNSTDYTLDLSDPLTNVLNLRLYAIQIPYTWYTFDYAYGNTCFWLTNSGNSFRVSIEPGNYSASAFCQALNNAFTSLVNYSEFGWIQPFIYVGAIVPTPPIVTYTSNNYKINVNLTDWQDPAGNNINGIIQGTDVFVDTDPYFTFFDFSGAKSCYQSGSSPCSQVQTFNQTLGWAMGFRTPLQPVYKSPGNTPSSVMNLQGSKYFILVLDDYNQNHINNGLVSITQISNKLDLPNYYNMSQPYICTPTINPNNINNINNLDITILGNLSGLSPETLAALGISNPDNLYNSLGDKIDYGTGNVPQVVPSAPRTLTQAQIYTVNEIIKNRNKTISFRAKAPTVSDTFALIPIKYGSMNTGDIYTDFSGQLQDNRRIYFGPVNIERIHLKLLDDKGNPVDLHGGDWSITLLSETLYQY
uniref:Uncharacterized protein n=1 Tax=viral metagenome TaxID=1070528 RepID=A0A6C0ISH6_9ZZZZ